MMDDADHQSGLNDRLTAEDAAAVDALMDASLDVSAVPASMQDRAAVVARLFAFTAAPVAQRQTDPRTLIDVTMARVLREAGGPVATPADAELTPDDEDALDAWVGSGYRASKVAPSLRPRAERLEAMAALVSQTPTAVATARPILIDQTMARIAAAAPRPAAEEAVIGRVGGFRLADALSVAAVILLGVAVLWPVLTAVGGFSRRVACEDNLGVVAAAMGIYGNDYRDRLPVASASMGGSWWDVGQGRERSNSANLFLLPKLQYTNLGDLACAGNPNAVTQISDPAATDWRNLDEVSYSYYLMFADDRPTASNAKPVVILADRSPVVRRAVRGQVIFPLENSPNHGGCGQCVLRTDGSVLWLQSPMVDGDNIWLPGWIEDVLRQAEAMSRSGRWEPLRGNELPASATDVFLGP